MKHTKREERRKWERLPLAIPVFVRGLDANGKQFVDFATALDISVGGALLAIHRFLPKGSRILLEIPLAPIQTAKAQRLGRQRLYAKAVRTIHSNDCKLMGIQFSELLTVESGRGLKKKPSLKAKAAAKSS